MNNVNKFVALVALVAIPLVSAAPPLEQPILVDAVTMQGRAHIVGELRALNVFGLDGEESTMSVEGEAISAAADYDVSYAAGVVSHGVEQGTRVHSEQAIGLANISFGVSHRVFVSPVPGQSQGPAVRLNTSQVELQPTQADSVRSPDMVQVRPAFHADVRQSTRLDELPELIRLEIVGDFRLMLWRVNGTLDAVDNRTEIWSGESITPILPHPDTWPVARHVETRMLFLDVRAGRILLEIPRDDIVDFYARGIAADLMGTLQLQRAGSVLHEAEGSYRCRVDNMASFQVVVSGPPKIDTPLVPGQSQAIPETVVAEPATIPDERFQPLPLVALAVALAVAALAARLLVTRQRFRRLERAFDAEDHEVVAELAERLHSSRRYRWHAASMQVVSLVRLDEPEAADNVLGWLQGLPEANQDGLKFLGACVAAGNGGEAEARQLLDQLLRSGGGQYRLAKRPQGTAPEGYA